MTIKEILENNKHRPWGIPIQNWKYYQEWNNVIFLHWQVEIEELRKFVPDNLEIDFFNQKPWVSLVAFTMEKIRPKYLPSFAPISNFDEINIRTYVRKNNKSGVYFLSIEGGTKISCKISKSLSELPYRFSKMTRQKNTYKSYNQIFKDNLYLEFSKGTLLKKKTDFEEWVTERYALFQDSGDTINSFEIHHIEWPLYDIEIEQINVDYPRFSGMLNNSPVYKHYSPGVQVIAWDKEVIKP